MIGMALTGLSMGMSLLGARSNAKAAQKSLNAQAKADEASRRAQASSQIAQVNSQNAKVYDLKRSVEIMQLQGQADAVMRTENYNDMMATAMVMGATSGRALNEGSMESIFNKSKSDYEWDQMWARNSMEISEAAMYQDMSEIYRSGSISLGLGAENLGVSRLASQTGQQNTAARAQQSFNNTLVSAGQSAIKHYGPNLLDLG